MALPVIEISGKVLTPSGAPAKLGRMDVKLSQPLRVSDGAVVQLVAAPLRIDLGEDGAIPAGALKLVPNDAGSPSGTYYLVTFAVDRPGGGGAEVWKEKWQLASSPVSLDIGAVPRIEGTPAAAYSVTAAVAQAIVSDATAAKDAAAASALAAAGSETDAADSAAAALAAQGAAEAAETNAETAEAGAVAARAAAEVARDATLAAGKVYPDTASGLAAEVEGAYFSVPSVAATETLILYRKIGGSAVEQKRYLSTRGQLAAWFQTDAFRPSSTITRNAYGRPASPLNIAWPDGATGVLTITYNADGTVASMSATHVSTLGTLTVTQPTITYVDGTPTVIPAITVA